MFPWTYIEGLSRVYRIYFYFINLWNVLFTRLFELYFPDIKHTVSTVVLFEYISPQDLEKHTPSINLNDWLKSLSTQEPNDPIHLYAELTREGIRQCNNQPWLESHIKIADHDHGYIDMEIDKSEIDFVSKFFIQLGTNAKVLESQEIIDSIRNQLQDTLLNYLWLLFND